jgi:hypothetical protein
MQNLVLTTCARSRYCLNEREDDHLPVPAKFFELGWLVGR